MDKSVMIASLNDSLKKAKDADDRALDAVNRGRDSLKRTKESVDKIEASYLKTHESYLRTKETVEKALAHIQETNDVRAIANLHYIAINNYYLGVYFYEDNKEGLRIYYTNPPQYKRELQLIKALRFFIEARDHNPYGVIEFYDSFELSIKKMIDKVLKELKELNKCPELAKN